jgi:hypothetical protein
VILPCTGFLSWQPQSDDNVLGEHLVLITQKLRLVHSNWKPQGPPRNREERKEPYFEKTYLFTDWNGGALGNRIISVTS